MATPRLTYVGHSYHAQTRSSEFMQSLLASTFEVTTLWDDSWRPGGAALTAEAINRTDPEYVVLFQQLPSRRQYARIRCANVTWMPMHDAIGPGDHWRDWQPAAMKVLCFCAADRRYFEGLGYDTLHAQYYPPPQAAPVTAGKPPLSFFFWLRHNEIGWPTLKRLLGSAPADRIVLRLAPDEGHAPQLPSEDERRAYPIELHEGWMDAARYRQLMHGCTLFVAPRPREGIGQAMLEARALGLVAIAPNAPTMNEYLVDRVNGYVYDPGAPAELDLSSLAEVRARSLADLEAGHRVWQATAPAVLDFIRKPARRAPLWWRLRSRLTRG